MKIQGEGKGFAAYARNMGIRKRHVPTEAMCRSSQERKLNAADVVW